MENKYAHLEGLQKSFDDCLQEIKKYHDQHQVINATIHVLQIIREEITAIEDLLIQSVKKD